MTKKNGAKGGPPVIVNRKAFHDYTIEDTLEVGIVLTGVEVKSIRGGNFLLLDSYVEVREGELWLVGAHIPPFKQASTHEAHDANRKRKLLAHRGEIAKFRRKALEKTFTIVPLKAYFKEGRVKLEIALVKGKKQYDKRETIKGRDVQRELDRSEKVRG